MKGLPQRASPARRTRGGERKSVPAVGATRGQPRSGLTESERVWLHGQVPADTIEAEPAAPPEPTVPPPFTSPRESATGRYRAVLSCTSCAENTPEGKARGPRRPGT